MRARKPGENVLGGISSSYYHEELIRDPAVDFVLRGSATEPCLQALVEDGTLTGTLGQYQLTPLAVSHSLVTLHWAHTRFAWSIETSACPVVPTPP